MNTLLESVISLAFIYLLLSLLVTFIVETILTLIKKREHILKNSIDKLLADKMNKNYSELFYEHPLIWSLRKSEKDLPAYISPATFSLALIEVIKNDALMPRVRRTTDGKYKVEEPVYANQAEAFKKALSELKKSDLKTQLQAFVRDNNNIEEIRKNIETWFQEYQSTVTNWFKKDARRITLIISFLVTIFLNMDSIFLFKSFQADDIMRQAWVAQAERYLESNQYSLDTALTDSLRANPQLNTKEALQEIQQRTDSLKTYFLSQNLPIGWACSSPETLKTQGTAQSGKSELWNCIRDKWNNVSFLDKLVSILGWFITALALSFGAPLWFDVLSKVVSIRKVGNKSGILKS